MTLPHVRFPPAGGWTREHVCAHAISLHARCADCDRRALRSARKSLRQRSAWATRVRRHFRRVGVLFDTIDEQRAQIERLRRRRGGCPICGVGAGCPGRLLSCSCGYRAPVDA